MLFPPLTPVVAAVAEEEPPAELLPVAEGLLVHAVEPAPVVVAAALEAVPVGLLVVLPVAPDETTTA